MTEPDARESLSRRLYQALGPLAGGILLDVLDLATFGPVGMYGGFVIAAALGWWISSLYELSTRMRLVFAALAAVYIAIPFTEILPLATAVSALARLRERRRQPPANPPPP